MGTNLQTITTYADSINHANKHHIMLNKNAWASVVGTQYLSIWVQIWTDEMSKCCKRTYY